MSVKRRHAALSQNLLSRAGVCAATVLLPKWLTRPELISPNHNSQQHNHIPDKGGHNFAKTLDAHNKNVRAYRQSLRTKP